MTTILPAYPKEMEIYIPPPPLPYCDNFQKYNGNIFWGLLPYEIEDKIMKYVFDMKMEDMFDEFQNYYLKIIVWGTMTYTDFKSIELEWENICEVKQDKMTKLTSRHKVHNPLEYNKLGRSIKVYKKERGNKYRYKQKSILQTWRKWNGRNQLHLNCEEPVEPNYKMEEDYNRFYRDRNGKLYIYEDRQQLDRQNSYSNSWLVMNINMLCSIKQLKDYIKDSFTPLQIKNHFGALSKYKGDNKNELVKKIYSFDM